MSKQIQIENQDFFLSENLEDFFRKELSNVKIKASHSISQIEILKGEIKTLIQVNTEQELIEINSEVKGTGMKLWLFVLIALPIQLLFQYQILDFHWGVKTIGFVLAAFIATLPGRKKGDDWEVIRMRTEKEIEELLLKHNNKIVEEN